jgi:hypothetical protein
MSIIPLHVQRRFEQRWAPRFGSLIPDVSKGSPVNIARRVAKAKEKPAGFRRLATVSAMVEQAMLPEETSYRRRPADVSRTHRAGLSLESRNHHQDAFIPAGSARASVRRLRARYGLRVVR